ncbi:hypothetical protein HJG60_011422 [Phyllostomus discolor]|uniref:Uncharacterized protein n=1 Tax=Phyllostomus discolor TaxID=89673 RepID=A0A834A492_9CHIR|nr:hypothetical protein HJG60_011422 [Phyllostomus discolor]
MLPAAREPAAGDSWGIIACLCTVLWHLPAVPALNRTGDPGPGPSIQKTYDLTRYLEHQLRTLAGTYPRCRALLPSRTPPLGSAFSRSTFCSAAWPPGSPWLLFLFCPASLVGGCSLEACTPSQSVSSP